MAKSKRKEAQPARPVHRADPERAARIFILGGVGAILLLVVGLIAFGWYWTQVRPLDKTILQVGETEFSLAQLERRMSLLKNDNPFYADPQNGLLLIQTVLIELEREAKVLEGAERLDVTVTDREIDEEIGRRGNVSADAEPSVFAAELKRQVEDSGLKLDEFLQMIKAGLLEDNVLAHFAEEVPDRDVQVLARWIILDDEIQAEETLQRLSDGEDFATVATEVSLDSTSAASGGDLGWQVLRGSSFLPTDIEDFLSEAAPDERSGVISIVSLFYIVELLEKDEDRELDEAQQSEFTNRKLVEWLGSLDAIIAIDQGITDEDRIRALEDVF